MREMMYKRPRYYTISHFESIVFFYQEYNRFEIHAYLS